jgi:two-component system nitrogen regulation response regulator GlnG
LRERGDDLEVLVRRFVRRFGHELGRKVYKVSEESMERLRDYSWPGNIRELQSVLKQALLRASGKVLLPSFLPPLANECLLPASTAHCDTRPLNIDALINERLSPNCSDLYATLHRELDQTLLAHVLDYVHGNQRQAARLLGIARQTLRLKIRELGVHVKQSIASNVVEISSVGRG